MEGAWLAWVGVHSDRGRFVHPRWHRSVLALPAGPRCPLLVDSASWDAFNATHDDKNREAEVAQLVDDWSQHPVERLRTCRLYIDAKFGRIFEEQRWNRYFYGARLESPGAPPFKFFHPNPGFRPSIYGLLDLAFLEVLDLATKKAEERSRTGATLHE